MRSGRAFAAVLLQIAGEAARRLLSAFTAAVRLSRLL